MRCSRPRPDPLLGGQRLGGQHQGVERDERAALPGQGRGVALGGTDGDRWHGRGRAGCRRVRCRCVRRGRPRRSPRRALDEAARPRTSLPGCRTCAVLCEGAAEDSVGVDQLRGLVAAEDGPLVGEPETGAAAPGDGDAANWARCARQREETLVGEVAVDALGPGRPGRPRPTVAFISAEAYARCCATTSWPRGSARSGRWPSTSRRCGRTPRSRHTPSRGSRTRSDGSASSR